MFKTIQMGTIMVQGLFVRALGNGTVEIRVGQRVYVGRPV